MKTPLLISLVSTCLAGTAAIAQENRYDVFARVISPIVAVLAPDGGNRALEARLQLVSGTGIDAQFAGAKVSVALQMPDKLLLTAFLREDTVMLARDGQRAWAWPGGPARGVLAMTVPEALETPQDSAETIPDFALPLPKKQLVFLPALFQIDDAGSEKIAGVQCRVLDIRLLPEFGEATGSGEWAARLWVSPDYKPARIEVAKNSDRYIVTVSELTFSGKLPGEMFEPPAEGDVLVLSSGQIQAIAKKIAAALR